MKPFRDGTGSCAIPAWVAVLCLAVLACGIGGRALWTADEPREAEIAREMGEVLRGWSAGEALSGRSPAIPVLAGEPFVEKPPLYYWLSGLMMLTAGRLLAPAVAARALSALCGAGTLLLLWAVLRPRWGRQQARAAALVLAVTAGFFMATHWILIDPLLMLLAAAAVLLAFHGLDGHRPGWVLAAYLAGGLAFLTKGFVAWGLLLPPAAALAVLYFREIVRRPLIHLAGTILLLAPGLAWAAAFYSAGGAELWREWLFNNNLGRFSGDTTKSHLRGPFYYLGIAPGLLLPWSPLLLGGLIRPLRRGTGEPGPRNLFIISLAWAVGGLFLLSLAGTKRDIYLYPLLPGFAVLAVYALRDLPRWVAAVYRVLTAVLLLPVAFFAFFTLELEGEAVRVIFRISLPVLVCGLVGILALRLFRRRLLPRVLAVTAAFYLAGIFAAFPVIDRRKDYEPAVRRIAAAGAARGIRPAGWNLDETTRAIFSYYASLTVPDLSDTVAPGSASRRLERILAGEDGEYGGVLVLLKRDRAFPPPEIKDLDYRVAAEEEMGVNRRLLLVVGGGGDSDGDTDSDSD